MPDAEYDTNWRTPDMTATFVAVDGKSATCDTHCTWFLYSIDPFARECECEEPECNPDTCTRFGVECSDCGARIVEGQWVWGSDEGSDLCEKCVLLPPSEREVKAALQQYLETALWSSTERLNEDGVFCGDEDAHYAEECECSDTPLDDAFGVEDIAEASVKAAKATVASFLQAQQHVIAEAGLSASDVGHNLWLTQNHHGAGFWDLGLGEAGQKLTKWAHAEGNCDVYLGDDGKLYLT